MAVTSSTLAGVNVWRFSGSVTDAEIKTAWASLIVNNRYKPARTIYIDDTCSLLNVRGTYHVDSENLGLILHSSRNKANTVFTNWIFIQTVGLSVGARGQFVRFTNGTTITTAFNDGIDMKGGGMIYAVQGNPGGADPRFLNEMNFGSLDGTIITSQAFAEQELQPVSYGTIWKGLNIQKCANIPIVNQGNQVVYRTNFNTEIAIANPISLYAGSNGCFISTVMRKLGLPFTSGLANTYASTGTTTIMLLNNWLDESYFGASKTTIVASGWNAGNKFVGGVLKKIQVQPSTLIRTYDSRSTTASQKSTFSETTADFLTGTDSTTSDAGTGKASIVCVGAIATGSARTIVRYTGQKFTLQKFGYKVQVETPDMTFGDDDLSAFSPIVMDLQNGITRTQSVINAATLINSYAELVEELHVLAIGLVGSASYNAFNKGNLFEFTGTQLITNFSVVNIDKNAVSKIAYNATTNTLTLKSNVLVGSGILWKNPTGTINTLNGSILQGNIEDLNGDSSLTIQGGSGNFTLWILDNSTPEDDYLTGVNLGNYGNSTIRFLSESGYKIVVRDNVTGYKQPQEMIKGIYAIGMYFGNQIQLAQNDEISIIKNKVEAINSMVEVLKNYDDKPILDKLDSINSITTSIKTSVEDKTGYTLTNSQVEAIATCVEKHLLDEGDSQMLINAIAGAIGNINIDETVLVAAIRADLERNGGKLKVIADKVADLKNFDATPFDAIQPSLKKLNEALKLISHYKPYFGKLD